MRISSRHKTHIDNEKTILYHHRTIKRSIFINLKILHPAFRPGSGLQKVVMLSIRLSRVGKKKAPVYRIVVMPKHNDPWAPSTEILGHYNPRKTPKEFVADSERVKFWISQGAKATDSVWNLLVEHKVVEGDKRSTTHISKKHAKRLEDKVAEAKAKEVEATKKAEEPKTEEPAA